MGRVLGLLLIAALFASLIAGSTAVAGAAAQETVPPGTWELQEIVAADGTAVVPTNPAGYSLHFVPGGRSISIPGTPEDPATSPDGRIDLQLDCNDGSANYRLEGERLTITELVSTDIGCPQPSLADQFAGHLLAATSYSLEGDALILFVADGGQLRFAPAPTGDG